MWREPASSATGRVILGIETSCDETAAAVVTDDGEVARVGRLVAGRAARALRRRRARGRVAPPPRARRPGRARGARLGRALARRRRARRRHAGPGLDRRAARRPLGREGASRGRAGLPLVPVDHLARARRVALPRAGAARAAVPLPARERRAHAAPRRAGARRAPSGSERRSTTRPARRSTRARGCSGSATRAARRSTGSRARAIPSAFRFPVARVPGLDFSFSGLKTALLYAVRDLGAGDASGGGPTSPPRTSARSCGRSSANASRPPQRRRALDRIAVVGGVAANSELRAGAPGRGASRRSSSAPTTRR